MLIPLILFLLGILENYSFIPRKTWKRCTKVFVSANHHDSLVSALEVEIRRKDHVTFGKLLLANKIQPSDEDFAAVPRDMVFLLLLNALQRSIKPGKKRMMQSMTLLSMAQEAGIDRTIVDVCSQVLCIATTEQNSTTQETSSRNIDDYSRYYSLLRKRLATYTHFWDSVQAVQTESKQRPQWLMDETNQRPLNLVTSLAVIDAMVKDLSFGLLAMQILRSANGMYPTAEDGMIRKSLYIEASHFLQHIIADHQSRTTNNAVDDRLGSPPIHAFIARTSLSGAAAFPMGFSPARGASDLQPLSRLSLAMEDNATAIVPTAKASTVTGAVALDNEGNEDRRLVSVIACTDAWSRYGCFIHALFACTSPSTTTPLHRATRVLVLGDGDLSFSAALSNAAAHATSNCLPPLSTPDDLHFGISPGPGANLRLEITATTLESPDSLYRKYAGARANHLELLQQQQQQQQKQQQQQQPAVLFNIDATRLHRSQFPQLNNHSSNIIDTSADDDDNDAAAADGNDDRFFDAVVFNFPFADTALADASAVSAVATVGDSSDNDATVRGGRSRSFDTHWVARRRHMELLDGLFRTAHSVLNPRHGRIFITLLLSQAQEWNVEELAQGQGLGSSKKGYRLEAILPFESGLFEHFGYRRKRTYNDDSFPLGATNSGTASPGTSIINTTTTLDMILKAQREEWARGNTVGAWTFVFQPVTH